MTFTTGNPAERIGKLKGEILGHAVGVEVLGITGKQSAMPRNVGQTIVYRRYLPYGATAADFNTINRPLVSVNAHELQEGVTPSADSLVPQDIEVKLREFGCLYQLTNRVADTYEDDVPAEMKKQCGERVGLLREMIRYGVIKSCANAFYSGGSSRNAVSGKITSNLLRKISRNLQANHSRRVTGILAPSANISTSPVEASYLVFVHTDADSDVRDLPKFTPVAEYGSRKVVSQYELGSVENFRFITSPELAPYANAGAAIGSTGLMGGTNVDVYPFIVVGEDAWGQVALRGDNALDPTYIPAGQKDKSDPLGQRGYVGTRFYMNCTLLNEGWMAVAEAGVSALT
ncbi:N4-gp56 family major capsid protein [Delftia sp. 60]|uniref:N4-gp56 family major capsid protein n=1 Tax=Delftia sp. 60 TaxID=2035216 RepID=UPI000C19D7CF|nr:N4-gp56 family major capsid protein [Delftia sp. 60]PIF37865.1 N4-gp56 family major capsid protein [Burkholderiales bacterium 23]PIF66954.1 N4-gp56 family major capsid protein [Delftia sp. 60]